jgi:hypothetical protein
MTNPIHSTYSEKMKVFLNLQIALLILYYMVYPMFIYFNSPKHLLKAFLSKVASHLAIPQFNIQDSAPYVVTALINVYRFLFLFFLLRVRLAL